MPIRAFQVFLIRTDIDRVSHPLVSPDSLDPLSGIQKLIATLLLVFLLFVTTAIGHPGDGNQGESSRSRWRGWDSSKSEPLLEGYAAPPNACIETSLSFEKPKSPRDRPFSHFWLFQRYIESTGIASSLSSIREVRVEAIGREELKAKQIFDLKFSAFDNWEKYDKRRIISMFSGPEERVYHFCLSMFGGIAKVKPANPIATVSPDMSYINTSARCLELVLDEMYRVEAYQEYNPGYLQYAIFSQKRKK